MNELKIIVIISVLLLSGVFINQAFAVTTTDTLFICQSPEGASTGKPPIIALTNKTDGIYISNQTIVVAGLTIKGCNGLAVDPTTGTFYAIVTHQANTTDRHLITIDPTTGLGTDIGGMGDRMASLAFQADGSLRTITGNASPTPEIYNSVNKLTGQTTALCSLPATGALEQGQTLTLNYDDNKIYHIRGTSPTNLLSTVDNDTVDPCGITNLGATTGHSMGESFGLAYNTNDALFYGYAFHNYWSMNSTGFVTLITTNPNSSTSQPVSEMKGMAFTIIDTIDPVISTTILEPIPIQENSIFDEFEFVSCIDDTDGDITNTMSTVGTVDTSIPRSYFVDYTCTDVASNQSTLQVDYIVKRSPTGSGGITTTAPSIGGVSTAPTASTTPPLSFIPREPTEPPTRTLDEIFDLFSFLFEEVEPIPTLEVVPESVTEIPPPIFEPTVEPTEVRPSFIESIQNFFARLFG